MQTWLGWLGVALVAVGQLFSLEITMIGFLVFGAAVVMAPRRSRWGGGLLALGAIGFLATTVVNGPFWGEPNPTPSLVPGGHVRCLTATHRHRLGNPGAIRRWAYPIGSQGAQLKASRLFRLLSQTNDRDRAIGDLEVATVPRCERSDLLPCAVALRAPSVSGLTLTRRLAVVIQT
jgi:hypothetical protein